MPILETTALTHIYSPSTPFESVALDNVNISIEKGEFVGIIGPTGSGKSTFIQHLNGLLSPASGKVLLDGRDINADKKLRRTARFRVGLVFQYPEYQLFEDTVEKDIAFGPKNMGLGAEEIKLRVREAAGFVGISEDIFDRSPLELSGGQKRRVAIAGVIAMRPEVLILDEPTAGLDPRGCESILSNILEYRRATGATILFVSHSMEDVARLAGRLIVFNSGRAVMDGTPAEIFSQPELLRSWGMDIPAISDIGLRLRELGVEIPAGCHTVPQLRDAVLALWKGVR